MRRIHLTPEAHAAPERWNLPRVTAAPNLDGTTDFSDEVIARLEQLRAPGESLSDVVVQVCATGATRQ